MQTSAKERFFGAALRRPKRGPKKDAFELGEARAKVPGASTADCPYPPKHHLREAWMDGFLMVSEVAELLVTRVEKKVSKRREKLVPPDMVPVTVYMPVDLHDELSALLEGRGSDISTFLVAKTRAYLRTPSTFELHTKLPFPKWAGSRLEDVIRMDPAYVRWMENVNPRFRISEQAWKLLDEVDPDGA